MEPKHIFSNVLDAFVNVLNLRSREAWVISAVEPEMLRATRRQRPLAEVMLCGCLLLCSCSPDWWSLTVYPYAVADHADGEENLRAEWAVAVACGVPMPVELAVTNLRNGEGIDSVDCWWSLHFPVERNERAGIHEEWRLGMGIVTRADGTHWYENANPDCMVFFDGTYLRMWEVRELSIQKSLYIGLDLRLGVFSLDVEPILREREDDFGYRAAAGIVFVCGDPTYF